MSPLFKAHLTSRLRQLCNGVRHAFAAEPATSALSTDDVKFMERIADALVKRGMGAPAALFLESMGSYFAESLLLTETGASTGAIQIAGTDSDHQLPFFVTTCDYTLIGEELYAASAYLSKEPIQIGTLRGQDIGKAVVLSVILIGTLIATVGVATGGSWPQLFLDLFKDLK